MKLFILVAVVVTLIGIWEFDELMMLHIIKKRNGDMDWNISDDLPGFGVVFGDGSRFIAHVKRGHWEYLMLQNDMNDTEAWDCIEDIMEHTYVSKLLRKCGILKA